MKHTVNMNLRDKTDPHNFIEFNSILEALDEACVFDVEPQNNGTFLIEEKCDRYYNVILTKAQMIALGRELIEMAEAI